MWRSKRQRKWWSTFNEHCSQQLKARNALELQGHHVIYHWYLTQRPILLKRSMRLIPMHKVSTRRARSPLEIEVCERSVLSEHPGCSPRGGAPHVIVYGIMVFHPMTPSRDKLYMTSG